MMHPNTRLQFISPAVGYGVVATKAIPAGTIVWAPDPLDRRISAGEFAALPGLMKAEVEHFAYADQAGNRVLAWDRARYVNHSCAPTCISGGYDCNIAASDLAPGDELTDDYGSYLPLEMPCFCGATACRGLISRARSDCLIAGWDARFHMVFPRMGAVPQPLWELLTEADRDGIENALAGRAPVASIADLIGTLAND